MTTTVWSPNLRSIITILTELQPHKRMTLLNNPNFQQYSNLSTAERDLVNNVYKRSTKVREVLNSWV
jgi:hypothetical protein